MGTMGKIGKYIIIAVLLALSFSLVTAVPAGSAASTFVLDGITFNSDYVPDRGYVAYIQPYDLTNLFHSLPDQAIEQYGNPGDATLGPWRQGDWFNFEYGKPFGGGEEKAWAGQNYVVTYWWNPCIGEYLPVNGDGGDIYFYQPDDGVRPMGILYQGEWRMFDTGTNGLSDLRGEDFWWDLSDAGVAEGDTIEALAWWSNALGWPGLTIERLISKGPPKEKEQYPGPAALDMDGDGSTEPLTFVGGGNPSSWHDPFYMGVKYATVVLPPPEVWVDDDYFFGGDNDGHTWCYDAFATIQDGINAVAGSIVNVAAGTYNEEVVINKNLTLISDTGDYRTTGVILNGPIALNNVESVTIQGFKFQDCSSSGYKHVIYTGGTANNITIAANSFENCEGLNIHIYYLNTWFENWTITGNKITNVTGTNASGIWVQRLRNSTISNNEISNTTYAGMILDRIENVTVSNNNISNIPRKGIQVATSPDCNVVIEDNFITNTNTSLDADEGAITIYPDVTNIRIKNNTLTANYQGFTVRDKAGTVSDVYVNCNNIYGNDGFGIGNFAQGDGTIDATNNWWGCKSGPGNPGCDTVVGDVDYTPWLTGRWQVTPPCGTPPPPPPTPPSDHGAAVGIEVYSVDKGALVAPWIALAAVIIAGGIILVRRRKAHS